MLLVARCWLSVGSREEPQTTSSPGIRCLCHLRNSTDNQQPVTSNASPIMIPLRHTLDRHSAPIVNRALVATNVAVFIAQLFLGSMTERIIQTFGFIPARLMNPAAFHFQAWEVAITLITSLFLHGGFV